MNQTYNHQNLPGIPHSELQLTFKKRVLYQLKNRSLELLNFAKYSYLAMVMILLLIAVVELKQIFHIDIFPGIDTPIDNAYFAGKDQFGSNIL
jgi:hypothetical protein